MPTASCSLTRETTFLN